MSLFNLDRSTPAGPYQPARHVPNRNPIFPCFTRCASVPSAARLCPPATGYCRHATQAHLLNACMPGPPPPCPNFSSLFPCFGKKPSALPPFESLPLRGKSFSAPSPLRFERMEAVPQPPPSSRLFVLVTGPPSPSPSLSCNCHRFPPSTVRALTRRLLVFCVMPSILLLSPEL
jgi:hypothetical protein